MIKPPIGMFVPGSSWLHRLDPRAKLAVAALAATALFTFNSWLAIAFVAAATLFSFASAHIALRHLRTLLWPVLFLGVFTFVFNAFAFGTAPDLTPLGIPLSTAGMIRGAYFVARLALLLLGSSLLTLTTSPVALTDALTSIMSPLRTIRVPVDDVALVFSIALRFIPTIADEAERIMLAQRARGAQFDTGSLPARAKAWVPVLVPLLVQLFRRADSLALAMESRCYSGEGRTRLRELRWRTADTYTVCIAGALVALAGYLQVIGV